ncbi:MAG: SHOCT domain-containing protein [Anaerolineae bacterium]
MLRMRGRQVARLAVGTAVMAGTAGAVHHYQQQRYDRKDAEQYAQYQQQQAYYDQQQQIANQQAQINALQQQQAAQQYAPLPQQYAPPPQQQYAPAPQAAPAAPSLTDQIAQLSQLHNAGVLSDEEFAAAKAKLLAGG